MSTKSETGNNVLIKALSFKLNSFKLSFNSRQIFFPTSTKKSTFSSAVHKADPDGKKCTLLKSSLAVGFKERLIFVHKLFQLFPPLWCSQCCHAQLHISGTAIAVSMLQGSGFWTAKHGQKPSHTFSTLKFGELHSFPIANPTSPCGDWVCEGVKEQEF